jgi:hypothetical protein
MSDLSAAEAALAEALQPVIELDSKLALQEAHVLNELEEIRIERRKLASVLRALDPERTPKSKPGPRPGTNGSRSVPYTISEEKVEAVRQLVLGFEGEEFRMIDVFEGYEHGSSSSGAQKDTINKALSRLRERGQVRLVATRRGKGGGNVYLATPRIAVGPISEAAARNGSE